MIFKYFNKKSIMSTTIMTTFLLSPLALLQNAEARGQGKKRDQIGNRRAGQGGERVGQGNNGQSQQNASSRQRQMNEFFELPNSFLNKYVGRVTVDLRRDKKMRRLSKIEEERYARLEVSKGLYDEKSAKVAKMDKELKEANKTITTMNAEMADSIIEKNKLVEDLPVKRKIVAKVDIEIFTLKKRKTRHENAVTEQEKKCAVTTGPSCRLELDKLKKKVSDVTEAIKNRKKAKAGFVADLQAVKDRIQAIDSENKTRAVALQKAKDKKRNVAPLLQVARQELAPIQANFERDQNEYNFTVDKLMKRKSNLLDRILILNHMGAGLGAQEGREDGLHLSKLYGVQKGGEDGNLFGTSVGRAYGIEEAKNQGIAQGMLEGQAEGNEKGKEDGINEGTIAGNKIAGKRDGHDAGVLRANGSDAASVGKREGTQAGINDAIRQGEIDGTFQGESDAINKYESAPLDEKKLSGEFAGAFTNGAPAYPGFACVFRNHNNVDYYRGDDFSWRGHQDYRIDRQLCPQFNPRHVQLHGHKLRVLRKAFKDGYIFRYRRSRAIAYRNTINEVYVNAYHAAETAAYETYKNPDLYPEVKEQHRSAAYTDALGTSYRNNKRKYFGIYKEKFVNNPDKQSSDYVSEFGPQEKESYKNRYSVIKSDSAREARQISYDANIAEQTDIFREKQDKKVSSIYENNAVIRYVSSSVVDGGVNSKSGKSAVGSRDKIFQPGENIFHSVKIANYGLASAENLKVVMEDGRSFPLPSIPAKSVATIKGAGISSISHQTRPGRQFKSTLRVLAPAAGRIIGKYFSNPQRGLLNSGDVKKYEVRYPVVLSRLQTQKQLIKGEENTMKLIISNVSHRNYQGDMKIELTSSSQNEIITKGFNNISQLSGSIEVSDAKVFVNDMSDVYKMLTFGAKIKKDGVTIGILDRSFQTMAKTKFQDKKNAPIVVVNSDNQSSQLLNAINLVNGLDNINVLDLSLPQFNAEVLSKGFKNKVIVALNDGYSKNMNALSELIKVSRNSSIIIADDNGEGRRGIDSLKSYSVMEKEASYKAKFKGFPEIELFFNNNMFLKDKNKGANSILQAYMRSFKKFIPLASELSLDVEESLKKIKAQVNEESFAQENLSLQAYNLRAFAEVTLIKRAHKKDGENSKYEDLAKSEERMYRKLYATADGKIDASNSGMALSSLSLDRMLEDNFDSCGMFTNEIRCAVYKRRKKIYRKGISQRFKKYNRDVRERGKEVASLHDPRVKS